MKPFFAYTFARLGFFVVAYVVVALVGSIFFDFTTMLNLWCILIALMVSAVASWLLLGKLRDRLAQNVQQRASRITQKIEESRSAEDVD